jgi:hypothetical protein
LIYAIALDGYVKFGKAGNVKKRLISLQSGSPFKLKLIAWANWPDSEETEIHAFLADSHVLGEWFNRTPKAELVIGLLRDEQGLDEWKRRSRSRRCEHRTRSRAAAESCAPAVI